MSQRTGHRSSCARQALHILHMEGHRQCAPSRALCTGARIPLDYTLSCLPRHYTFYIWKDIVNAHPAARYALAPAYVYAAWSLREALAAGPRPLLWAAGLAACTAAVLVPSPLVELRCAAPPVATWV